MNKFGYILFLSIMNFFVVLHTMEITPVYITHRHRVEVLKIFNEYSFEEAVPHIKNLGNNNQDWQKIFDDSEAMGELIQCAHENYKREGRNLLKAEMAISLETTGSYAWGKQYLLSHKGAVEKKLFVDEFLSKAEQDNRERMSVLLNIGIDIDSTGQDGWHYQYARLGNYQPALISVIKQLNFDLTTFLLEKKANPNILSLKKSTPLIVIIQKLYKADKNKQYENFYKSFAILRLLLQQSTLDISHQDALRKTASDYAIEYKMEWLQALLGTIKT